MPQKKDIANSLLQHNYFPVQKKNREEIPPIFSSSKINESIAKKIIATKSRMGGYDQVEYQSTRFNNIPRPLSIPHPMPYSLLCLEIMDNWDDIDHISNNKNSIIKPKAHSDGRIVIMDYDHSQRSIHRHLKNHKAVNMLFIQIFQISSLVFIHMQYLGLWQDSQKPRKTKAIMQNGTTSLINIRDFVNAMKLWGLQ